MSKSKVTRGRTGSDLPQAMQETEKGLTAGSREEAAHSAGRPKRVAMSNMKKLEVPNSLLEDGYYYRWFQDKDGRIAQAQSAYFEFVVDEQGNNYTRSVGVYPMVLMRLPQQYRDEDLLLKKQRVAATMEEESVIGRGEYAPNHRTGQADGGSSAITRSTSNNPYS